MVQLSHPYMTTGKTIALTRQTFVRKVMSAFQYAVYIGHSFSFKEQASLDFRVDWFQPTTPGGPLPRPPGNMLTNIQWQVKVHTFKRTSSGTTMPLGVSSSYVKQLKGMALLVRAWQNVIHWRREWQTTSVFLPWESHEQDEKAKKIWQWKMSLPGQVGIQYAIGEEQRNSSRKNVQAMFFQLKKEWRGWAKVEMMSSCGRIWWWKSSLMLQRTILHRNLECQVHESR